MPMKLVPKPVDFKRRRQVPRSIEEINGSYGGSVQIIKEAPVLIYSSSTVGVS